MTRIIDEEQLKPSIRTQIAHSQLATTDYDAIVDCCPWPGIQRNPCQWLKADDN